jgi:hypothetical protein
MDWTFSIGREGRDSSISPSEIPMKERGYTVSMEELWSLYNKDEKLRIDDLKTEHVRVILLSIPNRRMHEWYACREGDMQWQAIGDIPEFYEDVRALKGTAAQPSERNRMLDPDEEPQEKPKAAGRPARKPGSPPRRPLFEEPPAEVKTDPALNVVTTRKKERRSGRRYPRHVEFAIKYEGKQFVCQTRDIAIGGLSLNEPLPSWVPKTFRAKLSLKRTSVRVLCSKVTPSKLKLLEAESWDVIRSWIVNW